MSALFTPTQLDTQRRRTGIFRRYPREYGVALQVLAVSLAVIVIHIGLGLKTICEEG